MNPEAASSLVMAIVYGLAGACVGSYAATVAVRSAQGETATVGRSRCDHCGVTLGFAQTVPVLSFLGARGACSACGGRIDPTHPLGELLGLGVGAASALLVAPSRGLMVLVLGLLLLTAALIDLRTRRLPDLLTLAVAGLGLTLSALRGLPALGVAAIAGVVAFCVFELVRRAFLARHGRPGLGFGDVKLIAALALWLGVLTPWAVAVASAIGLLGFAIVRPADGRLPFGPAIALAGFALGLVGEAAPWLSQ